ncbi:unnamed protein product [Amaranthus hypochondriacus]
MIDLFQKRMGSMDDQVIHFVPCIQANGDTTFCSEPAAVTGGEGTIKGSILCPITPTFSRENGDIMNVANTPITPNLGGFESAKKVDGLASVLEDSPSTPVEGVFDSFAPGPDELQLAPIRKTLIIKSERIIARRLNFDDIDDFSSFSRDEKGADALSEKALLESIYETLLEAITSKLSEEFFAENGPVEMEEVHTPTSPLPLTGVAETCPGAPMKAAAGKSRIIDQGLCRKLEF